MLARWIGTGIIAALLAPATVASAQTDVPDLKGSWSGTAEIVHRSEVAEHVDPTAEPSFRTLPFTIEPSRSQSRLSSRKGVVSLGAWRVREPPIR